MKWQGLTGVPGRLDGVRGGAGEGQRDLAFLVLSMWLQSKEQDKGWAGGFTVRGTGGLQTPLWGRMALGVAQTPPSYWGTIEAYRKDSNEIRHVTRVVLRTHVGAAGHSRDCCCASGVGPAGQGLTPHGGLVSYLPEDADCTPQAFGGTCTLHVEQR